MYMKGQFASSVDFDQYIEPQCKTLRERCCLYGFDLPYVAKLTLSKNLTQLIRVVHLAMRS